MTARPYPQLQVNIFASPGKSLEEAEAVRDAFVQAMEGRGLNEAGPLNIRVVTWRSIEGPDVMVEVRQGENYSLYECVTPGMVPKIVQSHMDDQRPVRQWLLGQDFEARYETLAAPVTELLGKIDPLSVEEYQHYDGYKGLQAFYRRGFDSFLQQVVAAGSAELSRIKSMPLGAVWSESRLQKRRPILVVNAVPPLPQASPETLLLEGCPHQFLEGMLLAANTLEARTVAVCLPANDSLAVKRLRAAWERLLAAHLLPEQPRPDLHLITGESRFLLDDEDLLQQHLYASLPQDFWQKHSQPTFLFHGLMTMASLPIIARTPVSAHPAAVMIFHLLGAVEQPGLVEVPLSASLEKVINDMGGGFRHGSKPKAIMVGGPLGGIFPLDLLHMTLDHDTLLELGGSLAVGAIQVLDERDCLVSLVRDQVEFLLRQPGARCPTCHKGLFGIKELLDRIVAGEAQKETLAELQVRCEQLNKKGSCNLGRRAVNPILTSLNYFPEEYRMHTDNKHCAAKVCPKLRPAPCHLACPAGIDIPSYLALVAHGAYLEALEVIRQDNPFPWVCGLVCPHPCETACVRAHLDNPINIKNLKAFVAEWATHHGRYLPLRPAPASGHKVAIIGSGPAGLAAANFLALQGHQVTIFEALGVAGGTPGWGIPAYRLPRDILQQEIENIQGMGVEIRLKSPIGPGHTINDLLTRDGFEAVLLAVGAQDSVRLPMPGAEAQGVYWGVEFLREVSLYGKTPTKGKRVAVIGGGNVAIDVARVFLRVARVSLERGATRVTMFCLESPEEMPASQWEVEEAVAEGIEILNRWGVKEVHSRDGQLTGITLQKVERVFDGQGRFSPTYFADQTMIAEADVVIFAIGQKVNLSFLSPEDGISCSPRGLIQADPESLATTRAGVFAAGDALTGAATVVKAIAAGKQAALSINHYLSRSPGAIPIFQPSKRRRVPFFCIPAAEKIRDGRVPMTQLDPHDRILDFAPIELGYTETEAQKEARRCLRCDVCIRCGACEKVCRDEMKVHALEFKAISDTERILADYLRPGERCIACGACALACPTKAIDYVETLDRREVRHCGSVLNQMKLVKCQACGAPFATSRYLSYVTRRSDAVMGKQVLRRLCPDCARGKRAREFVKL